MSSSGQRFFLIRILQDCNLRLINKEVKRGDLYRILDIPQNSELMDYIDPHPCVVRLRNGHLYPHVEVIGHVAPAPPAQATGSGGSIGAGGGPAGVSGEMRTYRTEDGTHIRVYIGPGGGGQGSQGATATGGSVTASGGSGGVGGGVNMGGGGRGAIEIVPGSGQTVFAGPGRGPDYIGEWARPATYAELNSYSGRATFQILDLSPELKGLAINRESMGLIYHRVYYCQNGVPKQFAFTGQSLVEFARYVFNEQPAPASNGSSEMFDYLELEEIPRVFEWRELSVRKAAKRGELPDREQLQQIARSRYAQVSECYRHLGTAVRIQQRRELSADAVVVMIGDHCVYKLRQGLIRVSGEFYHVLIEMVAPPMQSVAPLPDPSFVSTNNVL